MTEFRGKWLSLTSQFVTGKIQNVGRFVTFLTSLFNILHFGAYEIHL